MNTISDSRPLHLRALADGTRLVEAIGPADLDRSTPCAAWDLRALLAHMIGQNHGFAAAVEDGDAPEQAYAPQPPDPTDVAGDWTKSSDRLAAALAAAPDRPVRLVELNPDGSFPLAIVVAIHLVDTVIHNWDVATSLGLAYRPDDETLAAALAVARQVPGGPSREEPGAAFGPILPSDGTDDWATMLALLGRSSAGSDG